MLRERRNQEKRDVVGSAAVLLTPIDEHAAVG